jgi:broad specificity phosphatase PhoE
MRPSRGVLGVQGRRPGIVSVVWLVRHGQASWGAADYDRLSRQGEQQSKLLGAALADRGVVPTRAIRGEHRRHAQTATHAGYPDAVVDSRWNEFDHVQLLRAADQPSTADSARAWTDAKVRWTSGRFDEEYTETYTAFVSRVEKALGSVVDGLGRSESTVVLTSAGVVAAVTNTLLHGDSSTWHQLQTIVVNTGITKVVVGARGPTLVSFNDHGHLDPDHVTYR